MQTAAAGGATAPPPVSQTLVIEGTGNGHGVGMSQEGAAGYARHGFTYTQILTHYYTGTAVALASPKAVVKVLIGSKVKKLSLERYVRGVIGAEMSPSAPAAALEAQAVASRTYALTDHAGGSRFDVYSDTRSQVYEGAAAESPATNAAAAATSRQILTYGGHPAITYFFASSGGMTESVQDGFPGAEPEPWLVGVGDAYEGSAARWKVEIPFATAARELRGLYRGQFHGVEVVRRGVSPRVLTARVLGTVAASRVSGPELAGRLGLDSTWEYYYVRTGATLRPEPDHSGRARLFGPLTGSSPNQPPPAGNSGGVAPSGGTGAAASTGTGGGTSAEG
jgi:SpoIID/LytB domain protein